MVFNAANLCNINSLDSAPHSHGLADTLSGSNHKVFSPHSIWNMTEQRQFQGINTVINYANANSPTVLGDGTVNTLGVMSLTPPHRCSWQLQLRMPWPIGYYIQGGKQVHTKNPMCPPGVVISMRHFESGIILPLWPWDVWSSLPVIPWIPTSL